MLTGSLLLAAAAMVLVPAARSAEARLGALAADLPSSGTRSLPAERAVPLGAAFGCALLIIALAGRDGLPWAPACGVLAWFGARSAMRHWAGRSGLNALDELRMAAGWDLLAAALRAGLPVPEAIRAVAAGLPEQASAALRATGDLIALGADPDQAWQPALACPDTAALGRAARRTARSGAALASVVADLAVTIRAAVAEAAEARAQRAGVLITAPLGLCFLPGFLCLGVVPVVFGLATQLAVMT